MDFDDGPKKQQPPRRTQRPATPVRVAPSPTQTDTPPPTPPRKWRPSLMILLASGGILIIVIGVAIFFLSRNTGERPDYTTVLPAGASVNSLGGWKRVSPPESTPVYAYLDTIEGVSISVSQQELPKDFSTDPEQSLKKLAETFNATDRISGTSAYIGTSAKGPQSVLVIKKDTLVMIKSEKNITPKAWAQYIQSLR